MLWSDKRIFLLTISSLLSNFLFAQKIDTTLYLDNVVVMEIYQTAPKKDTSTAIPLIPFINTIGTIGNTLEQFSPIFIKRYGAGQLASSSIRGGSAAHTSLKWNGVSIQNPMLGQVDLSSIPSFFIDKIGISYGNEYGLNATEIGAAIHINNQPLTLLNHTLQIHSSIGSFGQYELGIGAYFHQKKWHSRTRIFGLSQKNNYTYTDLLGNPATQTHAQKEQLGILQEITFQSSPNSEWTAKIWTQKNKRLIPKNKLQNQQAAQQKNEALRAQLSWKNNKNSSIKLAFIDDNFIYDDSLKNIHSLNRTRTYHASYEFNTTAPLLWAIHYQLSTAKTNNYQQDVHRQEWKAETQYQLLNKTSKQLLLLKLQLGMTDGLFNPVLPTLSLRQKWMHNLQSHLSLSRKYRLPTFNDLYWSEGGNPDLNPEKGWEADFSNEWRHQSQSLSISTSALLFGKLINQWIIWQPAASGLWSPFNAQQVKSYGLELKMTVQQSNTKYPWHINAQYFYTRSSAKNNNQLIYQPTHQAVIRGLIQLNSWELSYNHKITGKVFTTTDNSESLPAYGIGTLQIEKEWSHQKHHQLTTSLQIKNLWNKDYEAVAFYPMPGRSWHINIFYHY